MLEFEQLKADILALPEEAQQNIVDFVTLLKQQYQDELIDRKYKSFGTVEGILKSINLNGKCLFIIQDLLTNKTTRCYFDIDYLDTVKNALEQRVSVSGWITTTKEGEKISIQGEKINIFPHEDELPTIQEMIGILGGED